MGSDFSPVARLDRHELAHAFMSSIAGIRADPPFLFVEGWAMNMERDQPDYKWWKLMAAPYRLDFTWRMQAEGRNDGSLLEEMVSKKWYHVDEGPVYDIGALFVEHLIRKYGYTKFIDLYCKTSLKTFLVDFRETYGVELREMEKEFWSELDSR